MRIFRTLAVAAGLVLAVGAQAQGRGEGRWITADELASLPRADVVILGEVHDNPAHHENQARAVAALAPKALVFEMLSDAQALRVRPGMDRGTLERALDWEASGWPDFAMYYPIFRAAPNATVFGAAVARADARQAVTDGAAALFGEGAALFGLPDALDDEEQGQREALQQEAHCDALPIELLPGMVEAQRLRDAALARAVIAAMADTGGPVAVITGNGHARRDWGLARALERAAPQLSVLSIGQFESVPEGPVPYDFWLVTEPAERADPCAAFADQ